MEMGLSEYLAVWPNCIFDLMTRTWGTLRISAVIQIFTICRWRSSSGGSLWVTRKTDISSW